MIKLRDFAGCAIDALNNCGADYAEVFCQLKMDCCRQYHHGLTNSTFHGTEFFQNVLDFIDRPKDWLKQFSGEPQLEKNFVRILELNR